MVRASPRRLRRAIGLAGLTFLYATTAVAAGLQDLITNNFQSTGSWSGLIKDPKNNTATVVDFFGLYFKTALGFGGVIFTVQVLHGGYLWMTAGGNEEQIKKALSKITNGAIGVGIVFFAYIITIFVLTIIAQQAVVPNTGLSP